MSCLIGRWADPAAGAREENGFCSAYLPVAERGWMSGPERPEDERHPQDASGRASGREHGGLLAGKRFLEVIGIMALLPHAARAETEVAR